MDLQMTQIMDEEEVNDENDENKKVGILQVGTTQHSIVKGFTKIGRSPALCQIIVDDLTVSKVHAEIQAGCEAVFISDVRSANGTKIKDVSLKPFFYYTINDGDAIHFGSAKAIFKTIKSSQHSFSTVPETPIPSRRFNETNTPGLGNASDILFNNTSAYQSDDSVIPGTQQNRKKSSIFQEPLAPVDSRRHSNRLSSISASASEKTTKDTKLQNDIAFTDLDDLGTQQFIAVDSSKSNKSQRNDKSIKSQDKIESTDLHDLATQKMDYDSILYQSRAQKKSRSEKNEQYIDDTNIYDAETQVLLPTEKEQRKNDKKINSSRLNDSVASSSRSRNSSSNFSRLLQTSASPSPPPSPNPLDENGDVIQSQNLLEICETPLLELEKKSIGFGNSGESSKLKNADKSDPLNHVIAESDDDSATDDDLDVETGKPSLESTKIGIPADTSNVIEDDSATDDEGHFESLAARSPPKEKRKISLKMREKTTENRNDDDDNNIFDAKTQRIDEEHPIDTAVNKKRTFSEETKAKENKIDEKLTRMELKLREIDGDRKRRQLAKGCDNDENISEAATQRMDQEIPKVDIFEAATQRIFPESSRDNRGNNLRELKKNRETKDDIFDAETQQMDFVISEVVKPKTRRQIAANSDIDANIFDAATQPLKDDVSDVVRPKKRRDLVETMNEDNDIDLLPTQVLDVPTSTPLSRFRNLKEQKSKKKSSTIKTDENLQSAATQIIKDWDDIVNESSTEDCALASPKLGAKSTGNDKDKRATINSTSVSRSSKSKGQKTMKSSRFEANNNPETLSNQIIENPDDSAGKKPSKRSATGNSSLEDGNIGEKKKKRAVNLDETLERNLGRILDQEANDQKLADESMQFMTQNLVDILKPTQSFEESKSRDSEDEITHDTRGIFSPKKNKEMIRSPSTLGFTDGKAVSCSKWSNEDSSKIASTIAEDKKQDEEKNEKKNREPELSEWLDPDSILYGLPEVRISGTLSNPGSPCSSTTSSHKDFVVPNSRGAEKSAKPEEKVALSSTANSNSLETIEAVKSMEFDSPVIGKKSRIARKRIARNIIEDEDQDSDETFAYNDLKKMADDLLASGSVDSTKLDDKDKDVVDEEPERVSTMGRRLRRVRNDFSRKNDSDSCRRTRKLAKPSSSLLVPDFEEKRVAEETTMSIEGESSSSGRKKNPRRLPTSTKSTNSRSKAGSKQGKESQEVEEILAAIRKENLPIATKRPYAKVQLTRLDDSEIIKPNNVNEKIETPKSNRKRRATITTKDVTPIASPGSAKSRRTISEGLGNRSLPKEQHKILLTGLKDEHTKLAKKLGGSVVSEPSKATVLITDKVRRTYKFLCALARGLRVVSLNWLLESQKASRFLDCDDFILNDPAAEKLYKFQLEKSLQSARTKKFLQGYTIIVTPKVNQPEIHELKGMIEASGGKILTRAPGVRAWNTKTVIVSREEDRTAINALLSKCPKSVKITVQSVEFILSGILRQEVNLVEHKLDIP